MRPSLQAGRSGADPSDAARVRSAVSDKGAIRHTHMPELPEVETVARDLQRWVAGATITDATVNWERTIRHPQPPERFVAEIAGATIRRVSRRAKTVLLHLEDGRVMTVALRMTGALIVAAAGRATGPLRARRVRAGRRTGAALPRRPQVRAHRPVAGRWPAQRRRRSRRAVAEGARSRARYRIGEVFSGHGPEPLQRGFTAATAGGAAAGSIGASSSRCCSTRASSPASGTSTPTRRSGALGSTRCGRPTRLDAA